MDLKAQLSIATCAFASRISAAGGGCLAQVWLPQVMDDGGLCLSTQGQPFSVSGTGDLLALFRCVSCRYRFALGAADGGGASLSMGAIGRVFASGEPEMSHDVQQYDRSMYSRVGEAQRCRVHASLLMPLFSMPTREGQPVAVFEVAQAERNVMFPALIDSLVSCLQGTGLFTADVRMHAMGVGLQGLNMVPQLPAPAGQHAVPAGMRLLHPDVEPRDVSPQLQHGSPPVAHSEACPASREVKQEDGAGPPQAPAGGQQAASGNRSDNNSSDSIQTTRKRARLAGEAEARTLVRGHSVPEPETLRTGSVRSQRSCRFTTASLLSAGSSELTGGLEQGEERASMGAGKRLTLQQLQAQFGCGLKEAAGNLGICPTTLKRACRRHGIARWPRRPALRPVKHSRSSSAGDFATDTTVRGGMPLTHSASPQFDLGSLSFGEASTMPAGSIARPAVGASDSQPVMVLPDLAGWPSMSIPMAAELPMLAHRGVDSMDGIAHLLPGRAQDVGSATHEGALACAALGPLPACCSVGPPSCAHSTFEAGNLSNLGPAFSLTHFPAPASAGHTAAGMLPQLCNPPSGLAAAGKAGVHGSAGGGLDFAPASQPFIDQALLQDFSAGISGMELLLPTDGLATDASPVVSFRELQ